MLTTGTSNALLARLSPPGRAAILEAAHRVELDRETVLADFERVTEDVHFIERGFASIAAHAESPIGVGLIGPEGLSGSWVALGQDISPFRVVLQSPGVALRLSRDAFRKACASDPGVSAIVLGYAQDITGMVAETCWANSRLTIESRAARWLLMAHDRLGHDEVIVTHDTLARLLGVRRPGVTVAIHLLEGERIVKATRGTIRILDRGMLRAVSQGLSQARATRSPAPSPALNVRAQPALA